MQKETRLTQEEINHHNTILAERHKKRYAVSEITEEQYDDMHEILPPIYIAAKTINHKACGAFACSEAYNNSDTVELTTCWKEKENNGVKYYQQVRRVYTPDGKPIDETYAYHYGRGFISKEVN